MLESQQICFDSIFCKCAFNLLFSFFNRINSAFTFFSFAAEPVTTYIWFSYKN